MIEENDSHVENDFFMKSVDETSNPTCNICLLEIEREDEVWSCKKCRNTQHFECFSQYVDTNGTRKCIICRDNVHGRIQQTCYCGRKNITGNIIDTPGNVYVCGEKCNRTITERNVPCNKTCHYGPCKEFVKTPITECENPTILREKNRCGTLRNCGKHHCKDYLHEGPCKKCEIEVKIDCKCGVKYTKVCGSDKNCGTICNKILNCKQHSCEQICHEGKCGLCEDRKVYCFCERSFDWITCKSDMPDERFKCRFVCKETLNCGVHECTLICHSGDCPKCIQEIDVVCQLCDKQIRITCGEEELCDRCKG